MIDRQTACLYALEGVYAPQGGTKKSALKSADIWASGKIKAGPFLTLPLLAAKSKYGSIYSGVALIMITASKAVGIWLEN